MTNDAIIIDHQGIGYRIGFMQQQAVQLNQEATIHTYLHVREDELSLYGFVNAVDLAIFQQLLNVKGLGPKTCLNIVGSAGSDRLLRAVEDADVTFLKSLPGVGAKTASQMVLDLKGKLVRTDDQPSEPHNKAVDDALRALKDLGFKPSELTWVGKELDKLALDNVNELVRQGLKLIQIRKGGL